MLAKLATHLPLYLRAIAQKLLQLWAHVGMDRAVGFSVANSVCQALLLLATASAIARNLPAAEQGYYYTFLSIVGLQSVFELGFGQVITQNIAHAHARLESGAGIHRSESADLIRGLLRFANTYYGYVSTAFALLIGLSGHLFFEVTGKSSEVDWQLSWWAFLGATAVTVWLGSRLTVIEGMGGINWITRARFFINLGRGLLLLGLILAGSGLSSLAIGAGFYCLSTWIFAEREYQRRVAALHLGESRGLQFAELWHRLWPMQSRLAVSYLCGFFIFASANPILFTFCGPEAAARFGITWALMQGVSSVAISWNATKAATYGRMAGSGDFTGLWRFWRRTLIQSLGVCVAGLAALVIYLGLIVPRMGLSEKFLPLIQACPLMLAVPLVVLSYAFAVYARAHLREILAPASVVNAITSVAFVAYAAFCLDYAAVPWAYLASFALSAALSIVAFVSFKNSEKPAFSHDA